MVRVPKKRLPKFFSCPVCGKEAVRVEMLRDLGRAIVSCGSCGIRKEFQAKQVLTEIDVYCMFTDIIYSGAGSAVAPKAKGEE